MATQKISATPKSTSGCASKAISAPSASPSHAQKELGDIVYVDLPKAGAIVEQGKTIGSVESVKAVSDIYSPVSGEVVEVNDSLAESPENLNKDPHGAGWLVKIKLSAPGEAAKLLSAAEYQAYVGSGIVLIALLTEV